MSVGMDTEKSSARGTFVGSYGESDGVTWWFALSNPESDAAWHAFVDVGWMSRWCLLHHTPPDLAVRHSMNRKSLVWQKAGISQMCATSGSCF